MEKYMTPQEQQLLNDFLNRAAQSPETARDAEANALIQKTLGSRPDALYLLTQIALINEIGLRQAQQQIQELQKQQRPAPQQSSSFLGGPWGQTASTAQNPAPAPAPTQQSSAPGFLHSALSTASGIVAGEMAFSALRSLFGGHPSGWGTSTGFLDTTPHSETIVNNYYNDDTTAADNNDYSDTSGDALVDTDNGGDYST